VSAGVELPRTSPATGTSTYVYGVARDVLPVRRAGVGGGRVHTISHEGLAAIVSSVTPGDLRARRRDILAHQEVLQEAFDHGAVVPLCFGTVFASPDDVVAELLAPRKEHLVRLLDRFDGVVELSVRAYYIEEAVLREIVRDDPRVARLRGGGSDVALGEAVADALAAKRSAEAAAIERTLARIPQDVVVEPPRTEYEIFRGAFLVDRKDIARFDHAMDDLARARDGLVIFKYVGPLPPHSFVQPEEGRG
jgi:Gas vesicle synthesis protein GvpL/GvpF